MDNVIKWAVSISGSAATYLFGGFSALLGILLTVVTIDYVTGLLAGGYEGKLASSVGYKGISKKIYIFVMVAVGHLIDTAIGENHFIRDAAIYFYMANEILSIIENAGRVGVPIPPFLTKAVEVLKGKGGNISGKL